MSFADSWGFESELRKLVPECKKFEYIADGTFGTGRQKFVARLLRKDGTCITQRTAMEMVSKKSDRPYKVIAKADAETSKPPGTLPRAALGLDDLYQ